MNNALSFKSRKDWRKWLEKNYDKESHVWLTLYKKGVGKREITLEKSVEEAICFGWIDGKLKKFDYERYILRFSPRKANSVWSKNNKERAVALIKSGIMTAAGLAKIEEAKKMGFGIMPIQTKPKRLFR